jgi:hypothetical protein
LICGLLRKSAPEEVYPAELRGSIIIENHKSNDRFAPEQHNKTTFLDSIPKKFILLSNLFQKS